MKKVALVTGCGRKRVGYEVAKDLASRGFRLLLHHHSEREDLKVIKRELSTLTEVVSHRGDLSNADDVKKLFKHCESTFGKLNLLVHTASTWKQKPLLEVEEEDLIESLRVNLFASFYCAREAALLMRSNDKGGSIVLIGDAACERPYPGRLPYFLSKGSIPQLTRTLAVEFSQIDPTIRVNALLPGPILPPSNRPDSINEAIAQTTLVKKYGTAKAISSSVRMLYENQFITGECITLDGGRNLSFDYSYED